jgi:hypothetical protein
MPLPFSRRALQTAPSFSRDFAGLKTLDHGVGPAITFTRASDATYFDADGVLQTASNNVPRFDHSGGSSLGLLIEEARTNLFERSAEFDNAYWTKERVTISSNAVTAPDGSLTADAVFETTDNGFHTVKRDGSFTIDATNTLSFFCKANGRTVLSLQIGGLNSVRFDLSAVTATVVNSTGGTTGSITSVGNGWFRCVATRQSTVNGNATLLLYSGSDIQYAGDVTKGIYLWGAQAEAGAFATSYIPTTSAAATRAADSAVVTPISSFYNQAEGTLFAEYSRTTVAKQTYFLGFSDPTAGGNEEMYIETSGATPSTQRYQVRDGGVSQAAIGNYTSATANTIYKVAAGYAVDNFAVSQNGAAVSTDTSGTLPTVTRMDVGTGQLSSTHIRKIAYWPRRLSNTLLQQLTT